MALPVARKPTNGYQAAAIQGVARRKIPSAKIAASELGSLASSTIGGVVARRQEFLSARVDRRHREPYVSFFGPMLQATLGQKQTVDVNWLQDVQRHGLHGRRRARVSSRPRVPVGQL